MQDYDKAATTLKSMITTIKIIILLSMQVPSGFNKCKGTKAVSPNANSLTDCQQSQISLGINTDSRLMHYSFLRLHPVQEPVDQVAVVSC
jgi:hypothetical protein